VPVNRYGCCVSTKRAGCLRERPLAAGAVLITVIVLTHNSRGIIERCLRAVLAQRFKGEIETLVVDDSTDGTADLIRRSFPSVRLLMLSERAPIGRKRNMGVRAARGRIVAFTDSDCAPEPDWLAWLSFFHRRDIAVAGGAVVAPRNCTPRQLAEHVLSFHDYLPGLPPRRVHTVPTCNAAFKKRWLMDSGLFPEVDVCEDVVASARIRARGGRVVFRPEARVVHFPHYRRGSAAFYDYQKHLAAGWVRARRDYRLPYHRLASAPFVWLAGPARLAATVVSACRTRKPGGAFDPRVLVHIAAGTWAFAVGAANEAAHGRK